MDVKFILYFVQVKPDFIIIVIAAIVIAILACFEARNAYENSKGHNLTDALVF